MTATEKNSHTPGEWNISYRKALKICRAAGMSVEDGLAFTVCGGQLVTGEDAPDYIKEVNGCDVFQAAAFILEAKASRK